MSKLRIAVLRVISNHPDGLTGSAINGIYQAHHSVWPDAYPKCHPDSPRKRAGELAEDRYVQVDDTRTGEFGSQESVYRITVDGRAYLGSIG